MAQISEHIEVSGRLGDLRRAVDTADDIYPEDGRGFVLSHLLGAARVLLGANIEWRCVDDWVKECEDQTDRDERIRLHGQHRDCGLALVARVPSTAPKGETMTGRKAATVIEYELRSWCANADEATAGVLAALRDAGWGLSYLGGDCIEHERPLVRCHELAMLDYGRPLFDICERSDAEATRA